MNRYANSLIARGYSREYAENAAADRADRARDDAIDRELEERARLRDAAPALLEALQNVAQYFKGYDLSGYPGADSVLAAARAAIAKATR